ncbi:hypothetical protein AN926_06015 [Thermus scotoductus]|uniref:Uncharacterized protein n=1 Tax=Thermus scotoductus TaxID=37636 RepID=A0A0N1KPX6_THESC|nr:hypothetical protein AN926_06015 [Thermus scotoductus]
MSNATRYSTFLFSLPGLAESIGRPLDLAGATSQLNFLGEHTDRLALAADWAAIGEDLRAVLDEVPLGKEERLNALILALLKLLVDELKEGDESTA